MTVISETIAMNQLLKSHGYHTAKEFDQRLKNYMKNKMTGKNQLPGDSWSKDIE
jgi:serine kinase of HPr protein (carbohydrate metabolism regulator)